MSVETLHFTNKGKDASVIAIANKLASLDKDRKPHSAIRVLILEAGQEKIERLENEQKTNT